MRVYIPSYNRPMSIRTHLIFKDHIIVVHNDEQKAEYLKNPTIKPDRIIVSNTPVGGTINKQWIRRNLIPYGAWYVMADDNIRHIHAVNPDFYFNERNDVGDTSIPWRQIYHNVCDEERFKLIAQDTINYAETKGFHHCGFALTDNPYFNGVKFKHVGYVIGKLIVSRNLHTKSGHELFHIKGGDVLGDMTETAENLLRWGGVVINGYLKPVAKHYEEGGIGTYEQRLPRKKETVKHLMVRYHGLFDYKEQDQSDVKIVLRENRIKEWRKELKFQLGSDYPYHAQDKENPGNLPHPLEAEEQTSLFD